MNVDVKGHLFTLRCSVHSFSEIADVGVAVWNALGVWTVENKLQITQ